MPDTLQMIRQHQEIISLCHKLDEAVSQHLPRPEIYRLMDELLDLSIRHFRDEERLMAETGYPEIEQHMRKHRDLLESTRKFRRQLALYGEDRFTEWFHHWPFRHIRAHIEHADHQLDEYVHHSAA